MQVVSFSDLYAGKIVAALDRQHPRDLFDVRDLVANEGVTTSLCKAFIIYLLSHNRAVSEVLAPARLDIAEEFSRGFEGMTETPVDLRELLRAREALIENIAGGMPMEHRRFLISFKEGDLLDLPDARKLPAVRWRAENLAKLTKSKRSARTPENGSGTLAVPILVVGRPLALLRDVKELFDACPAMNRPLIAAPVTKRRNPEVIVKRSQADLRVRPTRWHYVLQTQSGARSVRGPRS
jgi:hypothetical protein